MPRIYLVSRANDATDLTSLLVDLLRQRYGAKNVISGRFDGVEPTSDDDRRQMARDITWCDVALVVIGPHWLTARDATGRPLLEQAEDPIHLALTLALKLGKLIAPVLSEGVVAPGAASLPPDLQWLARHQAFQARPAPFFEGDITTLIQQIDRKLTWRPASTPLTVLSGLALLVEVAAYVAFIEINNANTGVIGPFAEALMYIIIGVTSIALAAQRRSWRWLVASSALVVLILAAIASVFVVLGNPVSNFELDYVTLILSQVVLFLSALIILAFALFGPRREVAFA